MTHKYLTIEQLKKKQLVSLKREFAAEVPASITLPLSGSVKSKVQQVYDQGQEGSCTANAFCGAYGILEKDKSFKPSRAYVYWKERLVESGYMPIHVTDSGADVEDAVKYVATYGVCSEASWPYDVTKVDVAPPASCDVEASKHVLGGLNTIAVGNNNAIKNAIVSGVPVMIAIGVYRSFESAATAKTGVVPVPKPKNYEDPNDPVDPFLGGHEILIVGYTDSASAFTVLNSWGSGWGAGGYCYLPYSYVSNPKLTYELCCLSKPASVSSTDNVVTEAVAVTMTLETKHRHHHHSEEEKQEITKTDVEVAVVQEKKTKGDSSKSHHRKKKRTHKTKNK